LKLVLTIKRKKKEINWTILNKHSFLAFLILLKGHDHHYFQSSNRTHYYHNKKIADAVEKITKNNDFMRIYKLWESNDIFALDEIAASFK